MPQVIRVRDVAREGVYELGPEKPILRGPYELFHPIGPARLRGALVDWVQARVIRSARVAPAALGDAHPGERVLLQLPSPGPTDDEWWLCEVEALDGDSAAE
ncbi:MAG TPA: hypothetical protein VN894_17045 [Polyangiaceae bacterium]|nr:hypothetical protein [Polyangiaceae bacterium]